jgi:hypothetical protein
MENIIVEHIVIETGLGKGIEEYGNMGDVSMLQVSVDRLHKLFPKARIEVLTDSAENLARYCPTVDFGTVGVVQKNDKGAISESSKCDAG